MDSRRLLGVRVDATSYDDATQRVLSWAGEGASRYVCAANVHMIMEAHDRPEFLGIVNGASLVTPDGMPLVWAMRRLGLPVQGRVYGPELMLRVCAAAARQKVPIGLYGGHPEALSTLKARLVGRFPGINVAYAFAPPFRPATPDEDAAVERECNSSGARVLFVALGCPTQERWMAAHQGRVRAVMMGVGAAFDFLSGRVPQAPAWVQASGFEWAFRAGTEPRRLLGRYLKHNPRFVVLAGLQVLGSRLGRGPRGWRS